MLQNHLCHRWIVAQRIQRQRARNNLPPRLQLAIVLLLLRNQLRELNRDLLLLLTQIFDALFQGTSLRHFETRSFVSPVETECSYNTTHTLRFC